jgi:hypothetical protein
MKSDQSGIEYDNPPTRYSNRYSAFRRATAPDGEHQQVLGGLLEVMRPPLKLSLEREEHTRGIELYTISCSIMIGR